MLRCCESTVGDGGIGMEGRMRHRSSEKKKSRRRRERETETDRLEAPGPVIGAAVSLTRYRLYTALDNSIDVGRMLG